MPSLQNQEWGFMYIVTHTFHEDLVSHTSCDCMMSFICLQPADSELLGEMMFGSMPMKVAGNTVKIHYVRSATLSISTVVYLHNIQLSL